MAGSSPFQTVPGHRPLRVIVVGTGAVGMCWSRAVGSHPGMELAGLADAQERRARGAAIRLRRPGLPTAASLAGLSGVEADAVINATPPAAHFEVTASALRRGMAVLSEKPFAGSLAQAVALTGAARAAGRLLMISQSRSYEPGLALLGEASAGLGRLGLVTTELSVAHRGGGFRTAMAQPLLLDMAVHAFDAVRRLTGAAPVSVYCDAFGPAWSWFAGPATACVVAELAGGIRYCYTGSWCSEGLTTSWNGRWRVSGEHGSACWDGTGPPRAERSAPAQPSSPGPGPGPSAGPAAPAGKDAGHAGAHAGQDAGAPAGKAAAHGGHDGALASAGHDGAPAPAGHDGAPAAAGEDLVAQVSRPLTDFASALRTGTPPWGECEDNLLTLAMVEAAIASAATGTRVDTGALLEQAWREAAACA